MPDVRKDDMLARRTSVSELRTTVPFNQYLPNKSNQSGYMPTPLRKKKDKEEGGRKSWSTATSPIGGERPLRWVFVIVKREQNEVKLVEERFAYSDTFQNIKRKSCSVQILDDTDANQERKVYESKLTCFLERLYSLKVQADWFAADNIKLFPVKLCSEEYDK